MQDWADRRPLGLFTDRAAGHARDTTQRRGLAKLSDWLQRVLPAGEYPAAGC